MKPHSSAASLTPQPITEYRPQMIIGSLAFERNSEVLSFFPRRQSVKPTSIIPNHLVVSIPILFFAFWSLFYYSKCVCLPLLNHRNSKSFIQLCTEKAAPEARTFTTLCECAGEWKSSKKAARIQLLWWVLIALCGHSWCPRLLQPLSYSTIAFFSCLSAFLSSPAFILSVSFPLFSLTTSVSSLCPRTPALHQKENGKTANPTASYGIRVYQPIMPFSDLFSSRDRSLCACIPPPRHPTPFPYRPTKAADAVFSAAKPCATLLHRHQPPRLLRKQVCWGEAANSDTQRERDACQCCFATATNSRLGRRSELGGISARHLLLPWWVVVGA